jgi:hypothetical protein
MCNLNASIALSTALLIPSANSEGESLVNHYDETLIVTHSGILQIHQDISNILHEHASPTRTGQQTKDDFDIHALSGMVN